MTIKGLVLRSMELLLRTIMELDDEEEYHQATKIIEKFEKKSDVENTVEFYLSFLESKDFRDLKLPELV